MSILGRALGASLLAAALAVSAAAPADAAVLFTFQRVSDTEAILTATGAPETGFPTGVNVGFFSRLRFEFLTDGGFGGGELVGDFAFGSLPITQLASDQGEVSTRAVFFDDTTPTGSARISLIGVDWAAIGATNRVLSDFFPQSAAGGIEQRDIQIGTWEMIAPLDPVAPVPLPAAAWLLLGGLGALGALSRARRAA